MSKNKKKTQAAAVVQPTLVEKIVGFAFRTPENWPEGKARLYKAVERSLFEKPEFRHLSVLPRGSLMTLVQTVPV